MTAVPVTGVVQTGLGRKDSRDWKAWSPVYREGANGEVITTRDDYPVRVVGGVFSAMMEPGVAVIENPDGKQYTVTVPADGGDLWEIIATAVAFPPDTSAEALASAVTTFLEENPVTSVTTEGISDAGVVGVEVVKAATADELLDAASASVSGKTVLTGTPTQARTAISAAPKDAVIHASDQGIVADEETNVSTAFGALLNSVPEGSTIQLQGGTYNVSTLRGLVYNNNVKIRGVPGKTKLVGDGSINLSNYINDIMIRVDGGSISFDHIAFEGTGTVVGMKGLMELGDIEFTDCTFTDCTGAVVEVYDPAGVATRLAAGKQLSFRNFKMTGCRLYNCELGVVLRTDGGYDSVIVGDNVFNSVGFAGVWVGTEYGLNVDRTVFQALQSRVTVHNNVFRDLRLSAYADVGFFVTAQVNAVVALGQAITIHDNVIENVTNEEVWDDCEAIYTKGRYFDIHDNILINPGGSEAAIMVKGIAYDQSTTLDSSMNGLSLPQATINVASTEGFGHPTTQTAIAVETSAGLQVVTFTGKTATSFTGCSGGTGTMSTGGEVRGEISSGNMTGVSQPGKIHHNTLVFTRDDVAEAGITSTMPGIEISDNLIDGATNRAITVAYWADHCVVKNNRVINHHGDKGIMCGASNVVIEGNIIEEMDGSHFPGSSTLRAFLVAGDYMSLNGITIRNNVVFNRLEADGTRSAASEKLRFVHIQAVNPLAISDIRIIGNKARNLNIGINATADGPISDLIALDNDWQNEDGTAVTQVVSHANPRTVREATVLRGSSGTPSALSISPVVNQSGTAGYNGLFVDVTETSTGSGNKYLAHFRVNGSSVFSVDNLGRMRLPTNGIELGHASDTTLQRLSAGKLGVEGVEVLTAAERDVNKHEALTAGILTVPRWLTVNSSISGGGSGILHLTYFDASDAMTVSNFTVRGGGTAAGATPTLIRFGLYSVAANGDLTLIASTENDTTLFSTISANVTKAVTTPVAVTYGQRLAFGCLVVSAATLPTFVGTAGPGSAEMAIAPRISGALSSQTDLPSNITAGSVGAIGSIMYARLS